MGYRPSYLSRCDAGAQLRPVPRPEACSSAARRRIASLTALTLFSLWVAIRYSTSVYTLRVTRTLRCANATAGPGCLIGAGQLGTPAR